MTDNIDLALIASALETSLQSPDEATSGGVSGANVVDGLFAAARAARSISTAIFPDALPGHDATGHVVCSLTEAVMSMSDGLHRIADSIETLASVLREK
jgi:hypothetical protein